MRGYQYTESWFETSRSNWEILIDQLKPRRILEVGSFEGASACFLIDRLGSQFELEIHCVDTWEGGIEHTERQLDMAQVEARFKHNVSLAIENAKHEVDVTMHKQLSDECLAGMLSEGKKNYFDFVYIDGSHQAPDVLCDAVLGFKLLRVGGIMAFDDYTWSETLPGGKDLLRCPKPAIDAFVNLNFRKLELVMAPLYQLYVHKASD